MYRHSNLRLVFYRNLILFITVLAVVLAKKAGGQHSKRPTSRSTFAYPSTEMRSTLTSPSSSTTTTPTSAKVNSTYVVASSTNATGKSAVSGISMPAATIITTAASTANQQAKTSPGPGPVVKLSVETSTDQFGSNDIELNNHILKMFHSCLCDPKNMQCKVSPLVGVETFNTTTTGERLAKTYICYLDPDAKVLCRRVSETEEETVCEKEKSCAPDFTTFGPGCPLGSVDIFWRKDQKLYVDLWKSEVNSFFICNASCWNSDTGSGDDDADTDYDDDSVNPIIIGVVVSLGIVLVIVFLTIIVFMVHSRRKALAGQRYASSAQSLTSGSSQGAHPGLDTPRSSIETSDQDPHSNVGYLIQNVDTKRGRLDNDRSAKEGVRPPDPAYAYIDDGLVSAKNEYATLDEALQYRHVYNKASSQTNDPRLRPPLPLPAHPSREPLPYYSVARTFSESDEPGADAVSGQYLELIGETPSQPQSDVMRLDVGLTPSINNFAGPTASGRLQNEYFELEKKMDIDNNF